MNSVPLGELVSIRGGGTPDKSVPEYWDGGTVPWASVKDFKTTQICETIDSITELGVANSSTTIIPAGAILVPTRMAVGKAAITSIDVAINQDIKALIPNSRVDTRYLLHSLLFAAPALERRATGATVKGITLDVLKDIAVLLPPFAEQRRIAAILDQADDLRRKRREALAALGKLTQVSFHDQFGKPISNPNGFTQVPLESVIDPNRPITYGILMPGPDVPEGVPYVRVVDIQDGAILLDEVRKTSSLIATQYKRSELCAGDVLISIRGHVGRLAIVPNELIGANVTQDTARLAVTGAEPVFIKSMLETPEAKRWMDQRTKGAAVKGLNLGDLRMLPIILPPLDAQRVFAARVTQIDKLKAEHRAHLAKLDALFASLQHRAFRGEL